MELLQEDEVNLEVYAEADLEGKCQISGAISLPVAFLGKVVERVTI